MVADATRHARQSNAVFPDWGPSSPFAQTEPSPATTRRTRKSQRSRVGNAQNRVSPRPPPYRRYLPLRGPLALLLRILAKKRIIGLINLTVFIILSWQTVSIINMGGDVDLPSKILDSMRMDELPYPLNIVVQVHRKNITHAPFKGNFSNPGYAKVREGTFRNKYPSTELQGMGTFDNIFVISNDHCEEQWQEFQRAANKVPLQYSRWLQIGFRHVSLSDPPIPLAPGAMMDKTTGKKLSSSNLRRQIAYLEAHRHLWKYVVETGRQRVLILDDTVFPNDRLRRSLPSVLTNVDQESVARQTKWHFMFLRRQKRDIKQKEQMWTMNAVFNHAVVHANVSYGVGAYVLSIDGARFLVDHVKHYRAPLDVEIGLLQTEFPNDFVALSACNNDSPVPLCPEIVSDISTSRTKRLADCAWRRLQEKRIASKFQSYFQ